MGFCNNSVPLSASCVYFGSNNDLQLAAALILSIPVAADYQCGSQS